MKITVWGARGSIPVSGPQYVRYGGDTTCVEVESNDGTIIILDAGTGIRCLGNKYIKAPQGELQPMHLLLTHAHWDHVMGFGFFKPIYRKDCVISLHGCSCAQESIRTFLERTMQPPFFPVDLAPYPNIRAYLARVAAREGYRRAMAKGDPAMTPMLT